MISSMAKLQDQVFEKAVQDLVKICFPRGVLEELGVDVIERHMREEATPEANIEKMIEVYNAEMIQRVSYMLAAFLDTPEKLKAGFKAVEAASEALHGKHEPSHGDGLAMPLDKATENMRGS